ncbi:MAG: TolC family protein, partial [Pyrinomonadaceae bacterium]
NSSLFSTSYRPNFGLQFTQPLWRNRSIDNTRRNIRIQKKRLEQSDLDFRRNTMDVIQNVQRAYWDLVFALRNQQNLTDNLNLSRENLRRVEAQIAAGAAAPIARAEVNTELANRESDLLLATQSVSVAENTLKTLLLRDPNANEWTAQITPTDNPILDTNPIDLESSLKAARDNRPELIRLKLQTDINAIDLQYFRNQTKPRVDLTSTLSSNGLAGTPRPSTEPATFPLISTDPAVLNLNADAFLFNQVNILRIQAGLPPLVSPIVTNTGGSGIPTNLQGGFGRSLSNAFNFDTRTIEFGVTIQFPLRNRTAEANLAGAKIQQSQIDAQTRQQEQSVISEVRNAVQAVETARLRVISARTARENAEVQLAGENRLFQVGRSTTFLLFQRENELANARNAEVRAETDYNKALADLQRATSTTFQTNNITVTTPTNP